MTFGQTSILVILAATMALFLWGRWRHDVVAVAALLAAVAAGLVAPDAAFTGLGHPAVVTVACVLVLSAVLQSSGAVDWLVSVAVPRRTGPSLTIAALAGLCALLSAFMNNVGALALLMPAAMPVATRLKLPPGRVLMPLAFGSILGGMTTLIGTPPNLIVSSFRGQAGGPDHFAMFDFTPVGLAVALAGLLFITLAWRLVPARKVGDAEGFAAGAYITEARVPEGAKAAGMTLRAIEAALEDSDAQVIGLLRDERRIAAPHLSREVKAGDILVIEAEPEALAGALAELGLKLEEDVRDAGAEATEDREGPMAALQSGEVVLGEYVVRPRAEISGLSASGIRLRHQYGINLLALSRRGVRTTGRLNTMALREGDMLLLQGTPEPLADFAHRFGLVPLAARALRLPDARRAAIAGGVMLAAIAGAGFGLVPAAIAFAGAVLAVVLLGQMPARRIYDAVDWSVVVLLAALIPVAEAMASTGAADLVAQALLAPVAGFGATGALVLVLVVTMTLSDFMNNAGTSAVMCPVAIGLAGQLGVAADPFLMAVAIGASCAFLTPIGHQNNTLILGPGGFRFGDYWRLGLPLEAVVVAVAVPALLVFWPL
ncbi:SLC13 family permease [Falsiroseomonas selenitidurans]|uniref:SLC13 family permease n=1 Tax=Falsiroseomonas selenitidurans TaxID=2716335 RepID=A0ABX1DZZ5_9PROT|nr:SLC13 family permease [Falsiroseomonas selenitidurans]NKC30088.1 SLC13 family permease [Falsiroseomonas selenitidurans]